ncbi:MAG: hypothetical protein L0271_28055 [Gemmatimonadetes bacterium]|nr:hypothetical protein [Gemmatimonadota bacterium]
MATARCVVLVTTEAMEWFMRVIATFHFTAIAALGLLVACSDSTGLDASRRTLGILQLEGGGSASGAVNPTTAIRWNPLPGEAVTYPPNVIEAPDTVIVGENFQITVYTVGPNGCWRADGIDVEKQGRVVGTTPWDRHSGAEVCTQVLSFLPHSTTTKLDETGEWTIRASGRRVRGEGTSDLDVTAERTVFVRPAS